VSSTVTDSSHKSCCWIKVSYEQRWARKLFPQILGHIPPSQIRKFLMCASPLNANPQILWWVLKSQFRRFIQNAAQLCLKTVLKVLFLNDLWSCTILNLIIICHICKKKKDVFVYLGKSKNLKKDWIRKSQIRKVPHLRKVRKSNKSFKSANLWSCDVRKS
jgi:hypothetical protein